MRSDFALAHTLKKCKFDDLLLGFGQGTDYFGHKNPAISGMNVPFGHILHPGKRLLLRLGLEAFCRPSVSLLFSESINRSPTGQGHHPPERFSLLSRKILRLVPDLHEDFLKKIVG